MANWKNEIVIEVKLPYVTPACTWAYMTARLTISPSDIWFSGHNKETLCWKAYVAWGDYPILVMGKATTSNGYDRKQTTYKVTAWNTCDGMEHGNKRYKIKVISYS